MLWCRYRDRTERQADGLLEEYAHYRRNEAAAIGSGINDAIGKDPRNFETFAHNYAAMFR